MRAWAVAEKAGRCGNSNFPPRTQGHRGADRGDALRGLPLRPAHLGRRLRPRRRQEDAAERSRCRAATRNGTRDRRPGRQTRPGCQGQKVGDLRIVFPWVGCGKCEKCQARKRTCASRRAASASIERRLRTHVSRRICGTWSIPGAGSGRGSDLCVLGRHGLFGDPQGDADAPPMKRSSGRRRRPRAERDRHAARR